MTERRLLNNFQKQSCKKQHHRKIGPGCTVAHCMNSQRTIYVPVYISASLMQLVNVNLQTKTVQANFLIYISVFLDIEEETFSMLKSKQISQISQLKKFIQNNLKLQIGSKTVDIFYPQRSTLTIQEYQQRIIEKLIKKKPTLKQVRSILQHQNILVSIQQFVQQDQQYDSNDQDEQIYDQKYFTKKVYSTNSKITNHFVSGTFACEFILNSSFFPYLQIKSKLKINVSQLNYKDVIIKYNLIFPQNSLDRSQQFNFVFPSLSYAKFGIYTVNFNYHKVNSQIRQNIHYHEENPVQVPQKKIMNLQFKIFSYNIPFILRNLVPIWILCFASLMLFYANADQLSSIFGNTILLSVAFIFLLTNFRRSKYHANDFSLYEFTVSCFIFGDLLFIIDSNNHYYSHDMAKANVPSEMKLFHIYTGITLLGVFLTIIILAILGIFTFQRKFNRPNNSGQILNDIWISQILADSESENQENQNIQPLPNSRQKFR